MLQTVKLNLLIPLEYDPKNFCKCEIKVQQENEGGNDESSYTWFWECFMEKRIEANYQLADSPLLVDGNYKMARIELKAEKRNKVGIYQNENQIYKLIGTDITFFIGKIRVLFTQSGIAFLHIELIAKDLDEENARGFIYKFSNIHSNKPLIAYNKRLSIDEEKEIKISFKEVVMNIVNIQSYIPISIYKNSIVPYFQICLVGRCENENKLSFFDSIQSLSARKSSRDIEGSCTYRGKEDYISRFVGDRSVCIYGDTEMCGQADLGFITDIKNGLVKSATENYTTVYAFLISLRLLLRESELSSQNVKYIINAPSYLSKEDNIRKFYEECIWNNGWKINETINSFKQKLESKRNLDIQRQMEEIRNEQEDGFKRTRWEEKKNSQCITEVYEKTIKILDGIEKIEHKTDLLLGFVKNELSEYLKQKKCEFAKSSESEADASVSAFIRNASSHIDEKISMSGDEVINIEREGLELLFGDKWDYLLPESRTSLVSAGTLLKYCSYIEDKDFDFSGICICATSALEAELKYIFFDGLINFMIKRYGAPKKENVEETYKNWPYILLTIPKHEYVKRRGGGLKVRDDFTMGSLPYLFGEYVNLSKDSSIREKQLEQSALMKKRMSEYLKTIVDDAYINNPLGTFCPNSSAGTEKKEEYFVWKCEKIRVDYRNKAAHTSLMSKEEAKACYQKVITKLDTYEYNAKIIGVILELFTKIDGRKIKFDNSGNAPLMFSVGQVVELTNLEMTNNYGLRGVIAESVIVASLSKKHLKEKSITVKEYIGKTVKVRLTRWDINGQTYNAELTDA